jgi:hypothetical protein
MNRHERLLREARELVRESNIANWDIVLRRMGQWPPKKRPPRGSAPALVEPPRGPLPLQGGAEAPLEFDS